jgi:hypothetical protein
VVYIVITGLYKLKYLFFSVIVPVVGWTGWRMLGPSRREHCCPRLYGSTRCSDCNYLNLRVGVCYNQHEMLWTGIEQKALCLLERWNIKRSLTIEQYLCDPLMNILKLVFEMVKLAVFVTVQCSLRTCNAV